jgi:hypothetical protein
MMSQAAAGLAAGVLLAGALAGFRRVSGWQRSIRVVALAGIALSAAGIVLELIESVSNASASFSPGMVLLMIAIGGAAYTFQTKSSPFILLTTGLLLAYATLASMPSATSPRTHLAQIVVAVASASTLPALHASVLKWRQLPAAIFPVRGIWLTAALALVLYAAASLAERGAWLGSSAGEIWVLAAWVASSASLLTRQARPRAALLFAAALAIAFSALSM